jgi:hypothetical protein
MLPSPTTAFHRGAFLNAVLVVAALSEALMLTLLGTAWSQAVMQGQPVGVFLPLSVVGATLTMAAYVGLWTGRRWAFWLFVVLAVAAVVIKVLAGAPVAVVLLQTALQVLLGVAVVRRWSGFS